MMECIQTQIGSGDDFYALLLEELPNGQARSKIIYVAGFDDPTVTILAEINDWISSIWLSPDDALYAVDFEGHIYNVSEGMVFISEVDLLGVTLVAGFSCTPDFVLGEDGGLFFFLSHHWRKISTGGDETLYAVDKASKEFYFLCGANGLFLEFDGSETKRVSTPTNVDLHSVCILDEFKALIVGDLGVAFLYDRGSLRDITASNIETFQDAHRFKDFILVSAENDGVFSLDTESGQFKKIFNKVSYLFDSNEKYAITHGGGGVHLFDGSIWKSIDIGYWIK